MSKTITINTPALYGDHHVTEVHRLLGELPGIEQVYASSAFHAVEVTYDPDKVEEAAIKGKLDETGYTGELSVAMEADAATYLEADRSQSFFRHTEVFETTKEVVSFSQNVSYSGRPLWHCPGFGVITNTMED
jgi:copper chaperone CopZ